LALKTTPSCSRPVFAIVRVSGHKLTVAGADARFE
jgi:hypothetical protein